MMRQDKIYHWIGDKVSQLSNIWMKEAEMDYGNNTILNKYTCYTRETIIYCLPTAVLLKLSLDAPNKNVSCSMFDCDKQMNPIGSILHFGKVCWTQGSKDDLTNGKLTGRK